MPVRSILSVRWVKSVITSRPLPTGLSAVALKSNVSTPPPTRLRVLATLTAEPVARPIADQRVVGGGAEHALDPGQRVGLGAALGGIRAARYVDPDRSANVVAHGIDAGPTIDLVVAGAAVEGVATIIAVERVVAGLAIDPVVAGEAGDGVGAAGAAELVVVGRGGSGEVQVQFGGADVRRGCRRAAAGWRRSGRPAWRRRRPHRRARGWPCCCGEGRRRRSWRPRC